MRNANSPSPRVDLATQESDEVAVTVHLEKFYRVGRGQLVNLEQRPQEGLCAEIIQ